MHDAFRLPPPYCLPASQYHLKLVQQAGCREIHAFFFALAEVRESTDESVYHGTPLCFFSCIQSQNAPRPSEHLTLRGKFLTFSVLVWLPTRKTTSHGDQSRSWSAEQGKEHKIKSLAAYPPPPPHCSCGENK